MTLARRRACSAVAWLAAVVAAAMLLSADGSQAQEKKSVKAGVYSGPQAERGAVLYKKYCASCHAPSRFTDDQLFLTPYAGKPLWEMFDVISDSMPEDNPGGLKPDEYADVIAVLLQMNGFPAGQDDLPASKDVLSLIVFEKP